MLETRLKIIISINRRFKILLLRTPRKNIFKVWMNSFPDDCLQQRSKKTIWVIPKRIYPAAYMVSLSAVKKIHLENSGMESRKQNKAQIIERRDLFLTINRISMNKKNMS